MKLKDLKDILVKLNFENPGYRVLVFDLDLDVVPSGVLDDGDFDELDCALYLSDDNEKIRNALRYELLLNKEITKTDTICSYDGDSYYLAVYISYNQNKKEFLEEDIAELKLKKAEIKKQKRIKKLEKELAELKGE